MTGLGYGVQTPRLMHCPHCHGEMDFTSLGKEAIDLAATAGLILDPWQCLVLDHSLGVRDTGGWLTPEVGVIVTRQNGKGSILEAREMAGLFLFGEMDLTHSAHQFDTSMNHYDRMVERISNTPELHKRVKGRSGYVRSHGLQSINLKTGASLNFRTRTKAGGRGFTGDLLVLDEAMIFDLDAAGALIPTVSARGDKIQVWYTGSSGLGEQSAILGRIRNRAIRSMNSRPGERGYDHMLCFFEWSIDNCSDLCPKDCNEHDAAGIDNEFSLRQEDYDRAFTRLVESYKKSNPALGYRLTVEACERDRRSMGPEQFKCERLGVGQYPAEGEGWKIIPEQNWSLAEDEFAEPDVTRPVVFAVDTTPDRSYTSIAVAGAHESGKLLTQLTQTETEVDQRPGTAWVVNRLVELHERYGQAQIVLNPAYPAGSFIEPLKKKGIEVYQVPMREYAQWCGEYYTALCPRRGEEQTLIHPGQVQLTAAVAGAEKRDASDLWYWDRKNVATDISPLVASTMAVGTLRKHLNELEAADPWCAYIDI